MAKRVRLMLQVSSLAMVLLAACSGPNRSANLSRGGLRGPITEGECPNTRLKITVRNDLAAWYAGKGWKAWMNYVYMYVDGERKLTQTGPHSGTLECDIQGGCLHAIRVEAEGIRKRMVRTQKLFIKGTGTHQLALDAAERKLLEIEIRGEVGRNNKASLVVDFSEY